MNTKFLKKVEKIIEFFIKNNIDTGYKDVDPENPINMLKQLLSLKDLSERNELIDKVEASITEILLR
jgi:hypothetical protein